VKLIFLLPCILLVGSIHAQQIFHGSIVYKYHFPQINDATEITVFYGPNKIKVKFNEKEDYDKSYTLIDLDSGKIFTVNTETKTFFSRKLNEAYTKQPSITKTIAGYKTNSVNVKNSAFGSSGLFSPTSTTVLFSASDLYYPVPEKYAGIPELIMIQNSHIVLGVEQNLEPAEEISDSIKQQTSVTIEAIKINAEQINMAEFSIPPDFKRISLHDLKVSNVTLDPIYKTETVEPPPPPANKKSKINSTSPKKTTATKTEAIKPKKTQTKS
jgi:hypothetical protein